MEYLFATNNKGKLIEIRWIFAEKGWKVRGLDEYGITSDPAETGHTFADNAVLKARFCASEIMKAADRGFAIFGGVCVLADDSGLCIDALDGQPGVISARWLGEDTPYTEKNKQIIDMLTAIPEEKRAARFVCVIACVLPNGQLFTTEAAVEGRIAYEPKGANGFGYDPIFYLPEYGRTSAELAPEEKNRISHRGKALRAMLDKLGSL